MQKIIGSFYLKRNDAGNLTGEYTNNVRCTVSPESADLKEAGMMPYEGRYLSTWLEGGEPHSGELVIDTIAGSAPGTIRYTLVWNDRDAGNIYTAEAILAEGMLVGHFVSLS